MRPALALLVLAAACAAREPPPTPPPPFTRGSLSYKFYLPASLAFQRDELVYNVTLARDGSASRARQDTRSNLAAGAVTLVVDARSRSFSETGPRIHRTSCSRFPADDEADALLTAPAFPDVREGGWEFRGRRAPRVGGAGSDRRRRALPLLTSADGTAHEWRLRQAHRGRETEYVFWADPATGAPVALRQSGPDLLTGSHFDAYRVIYTGKRDRVE